MLGNCVCTLEGFLYTDSCCKREYRNNTKYDSANFSDDEVDIYEDGSDEKV